MHRRKTFICTLILGLNAALIHAQGLRTSPYQLKAAFLYNFAKFIDWPPTSFQDDKSPFIIGVLGNNPFGTDLNQMVAGKTINDHPILIANFHATTDVTNCQILFISSSEKKMFPAIIERLRSIPVLTVSESDGFLEAGGMVNFVQDSSKIHFQINNDAAKSSGLKISSRLLSLAVPAH